MWICENCDQINLDTDKKCRKCGEPREKSFQESSESGLGGRCPECGAQIKSDWNYCIYCGARLK